MKKISFLIASLVLVGFVGGTVFAQEVEEPVVLIPEDLPELPNPGLKPGDFFYFLDIWVEAIREFFTFDPEAKAILQAERALERIAEIKALLEAEGVETPGLEVAEKKIQQNMAKAARILEEQKGKGVIVAQLAKKLDNKFDTCQALLKEVFKMAKENLKAQEKALKVQIREARLAGDFEKIEQLRAALINIETRKEMVDARKDLLEEILEAEEERIEAKLEAREKELEVLAEEAEDLFDQREKNLERAFEQKEKALELQEKALEVQLKQAILAEDATLIDQIRAQLLDLEAQEEALEAEEEALEESLELEKGKLKRAMVMKERAAEQIEEAREEILDVKEEMLELVEVPPAVSELIREAESKLALAEQAFEAESYGKAFGQAMAAEMLARNAERILEEKEEVMEKLEELEEKLEEAGRAEEALKEAQRRLEQAVEEEKEELKEKVEEARKKYQERLKEIEKERKELEEIKREIREEVIPNIILCETDWDCRYLICPQVIGQDTPQCGPGGICICGPRGDIEGIPERPERPEMPGRLR